MVKKDKKYNFDLVTPADAVDYDPLAGDINNDNIKHEKWGKGHGPGPMG